MMKLSLQSSLIVLTVVIIVVSGASQVSAAIPTAERNALIDLYNSTGGVNWTHNAGWLGAHGTECSWERVTCDPGKPLSSRSDSTPAISSAP